MVVKVTHFECPGSEIDCPPEGFEVVESNAPTISQGDFLLNAQLEELRGLGAIVEIVEEEADDEEAILSTGCPDIICL